MSTAIPTLVFTSRKGEGFWERHQVNVVPRDNVLALGVVDMFELEPGDRMFFPDAHKDHVDCVVTDVGTVRRI